MGGLKNDIQNTIPCQIAREQVIEITLFQFANKTRFHFLYHLEYFSFAVTHQVLSLLQTFIIEVIRIVCYLFILNLKIQKVSRPPLVEKITLRSLVEIICNARK